MVADSALNFSYPCIKSERKKEVVLMQDPMNILTRMLCLVIVMLACVTELYVDGKHVGFTGWEVHVNMDVLIGLSIMNWKRK